MAKFFMRFFGVLNLLFVGVGVWYAIEMRALRMAHGKWPPYPPAGLDWFLYFAFLALSTALIVWLSYLSIRLILTDRKALLPNCILFGIEIAYMWVEVWVFWLIAPRWITDRSWFWTMGMDPLAPQFAYYYPFLGILASLALFLTTRTRQSPPQALTTPLS